MPKGTFSRRSFLKTLAAGAAVSILPRDLAFYAPSTTATLPNGVAAGDMTQTSAVLWAHSTAPGTLTFAYTQVPFTIDSSAILGTFPVEVKDPMIPVKVQLDKLRPGTQYYYRATDAAGSAVMGRFRTPAAPGEKIGLRFGVSGDWRGELRPYLGVSNAADRELDFFMMLGDSIYSDFPTDAVPKQQATTLSDFRAKHNEVYSSLYDRNTLVDLRTSTGVYAILDDHEVTNNFAGGAPPSSDPRFDQTGTYINQTRLYRNGTQVFQEYNPLRREIYQGTDDPRMEGRPRFYRCVTFGSTAAIYVLDARSFRDKEEPQLNPFQVLNPFAVVGSLASMFTPGRTMLGRRQVEDFKRDLLAAQQAGILWKFVMIPEPIQNMGWLGGVDRWEGYSPERTEVLKFIEDNQISNVVFISADVHSTFINNLTYQTEASGKRINTHTWEISTGSVAFYPPTGKFIIDSAAQIGLVSKQEYADYQKMSIAEKDHLLEGLFDRVVLELQGFSPLGLEDSEVNWQRISGGWVVGHTFGWTEFDIDAETQVLTVTTYGAPAYSHDQIKADVQSILALKPEIRSQLVITPA